MTDSSLRRQLTPSDALIVGIGSMVGAGVFAVWAPAAAVAGSWMIISLVIAGIIALCNATSSAQLAAQHPESGGTYVYARERLSPFWGHVAGWGFVVGKTASCAAMALTAGNYIWPDRAQIVATGSVVLIAIVNLGGLSRTAAVTRLLLAFAGMALLVVILSSFLRTPAEQATLSANINVDTYGVLQAGGLMFFAFAGYARIATFGEEVINPERTIPWAIPRALGAVLALYLIVGFVVLSADSPEQIAQTTAPLDHIVSSSSLSTLSPIVAVGAGIACLGVLLNLIPGVARTILALGRRHELPSWLAFVSPHRSLPLRAEVTVVFVVIAIVNTVSLTSSISLSGVAVLTYYAITNAAALQLGPHERRWPRWIAWVGLAGCALLAISLPWKVVVTGVLVMAVGLLARFIALRTQRPT
jgi:APA family basic amino acid/polyamine antiporter